MAELSAGTLLDARYRVAGALGRGGMATVYLATDEQTGERVALKLLHAHLAADPAARKRLEREVAAAARLEHPGVLVARDLIESDGQIGLVLPLHTGRTLAEQVAMNGRLAPDQVRRVGLRLAEALGAAHLAGVLHRDLSPRNVLMDDRGAPVLTDFGMARLTEQRTARSTALLGTAGFVAPEVLSGQRADPRSDLYGLGAVLYQAATGTEPFAAAHPSAALQRQLAGDVRPIRDVVPDFPDWLDQLLLSLLDPDPDRRPQGAAALVAALEEGRALDPPPVAHVEDPPPVAQVEEPPSSAAPATRGSIERALPAGEFTVVVREPDEVHGRRKRRRHRRRGARHRRREGVRFIEDVAGAVEEIAAGIGEALEGEQPDVEPLLLQAVAREAGVPAQGVTVPTALTAQRYRLVSHVPREVADRLANEARGLGLKASVHPVREPDDPVGWLLSRWWAAIPIMWVLFPAIVSMGVPGEIVFLFVALSILLPTVVGPWVQRKMLPDHARSLPIAFRAQGAPALSQAQPATQVAASQAAASQSATASATSQDPAPPPPPPTRSALVAAQASAALDQLDAGIAAASSGLAAVVARELKDAAAALRQEVADLSADVAGLEAALDARAGVPTNAWAAERLARLRTLAAAGTHVDDAEQARLQAAVDAHEAAVAAEAALESRLNADLARLLEIAATARRLERELRLDHAAVRSPEKAMDDLRERARAAAAARRELG